MSTDEARAQALRSIESFRLRIEAEGVTAAVPAVLLLAVLGTIRRWVDEYEGRVQVGRPFDRLSAAVEMLEALVLAQKDVNSR